MTLPAGLSTASISFGPYTDLEGNVAYAGMQGILTVSRSLEYLPTGAVIDAPVTVTIAADGTASVGPLPCLDDPNLYPQGTTYTLRWQALSYRPTPGDKTFTLSVADEGLVVDYDLIGTGQTPTGTTAIVGSALVGTATVA